MRVEDAMSKPYTIALFGEAEKGAFRTAYYCHNLIQLADNFGEPPADSMGLEFAVQTLLFNRGLIFFRVHEEGFSIQDYLLGLRYLENKEQIPNITAICLPGVGSHQIIEATTNVCNSHSSFLIVSERDLYDYLTNKIEFET